MQKLLCYVDSNYRFSTRKATLPCAALLTYRKLIKASVGLHKGVRVRAADLDARQLPRQDVARAVEPYRSANPFSQHLCTQTR